MARLQIGKSPMFTASYYGHLDVMKALIEAGDNVNQLDKVGTLIFSATVLHSHPYFHHCLGSDTCSVQSVKK